MLLILKPLAHWIDDIPAFFNANPNSLSSLASKTPIRFCHCSIILETEPVLILNSDAILSLLLPLGFETEDLVNEPIDMGNNTTTSNATIAYAQGNETGMSMDNSTMMNATITYAQGEGEDNTGMTEDLRNDTGITESQTDGKGDIDTGNNGGGE